jgi:hypothetical protein
MICLADVLAAVLLSSGAYFPVLARVDLIRIGPERSFLKYASAEAKQARIHWNPKVSQYLPHAAVDFLESHQAGLWSTALDGIGDRNEQTLAVSALGFEHKNVTSLCREQKHAVNA